VRSRSGNLGPTALVWGPTTAQCLCLGSVTKERVVILGPQPLFWVPLQLNVYLLVHLATKFKLHTGHRAYLKSTSGEIQLLLYFTGSQLVLQSILCQGKEERAGIYLSVLINRTDDQIWKSTPLRHQNCCQQITTMPTINHLERAIRCSDCTSGWLIAPYCTQTSIH
jgi:hypothetical protein